MAATAASQRRAMTATASTFAAPAALRTAAIRRWAAHQRIRLRPHIHARTRPPIFIRSATQLARSNRRPAWFSHCKRTRRRLQPDTAKASSLDCLTALPVIDASAVSSAHHALVRLSPSHDAAHAAGRGVSLPAAHLANAQDKIREFEARRH